VSARRLPDDEVDRLLREAFPDDLPAPIEDVLRQDARRAWRRAAASPHPSRWRDWLGRAGRAALPQPALAAAALAMLAAGTAMQAAPAPAGVVAALEGRHAASRAAAAVAHAGRMRCTIDVASGPGRSRRYEVAWEAGGAARVRFDGEAGPVERTVRFREPNLRLATPAQEEAPLDADVAPVRAFLTAEALAARLAAPGVSATLDPKTHLPLRLEATGPDGRKQAAACRWP
jgi:hypothetical protein